MSDRISKHFTRSEYACKCGCGLDNIDIRQVVISEVVRAFDGGKPYTLNSACRCLEHNETVQLEHNKNYIPFSSRSKHMPYDEDDMLDEEEGLCIATDYPSKNSEALYKHLDGLFPKTYGIFLYPWGCTC